MSRIENSATVKRLLLTGQAYMGFELPKYFSRCKFSDLLLHISDSLEETSNGLSDIADLKKVDRVPTINYKFYLNKDGKYAWRLLELQHPAIYTELVNILSKSAHWHILQRKLREHRGMEGTIHAASDIIIPCPEKSTGVLCGCGEEKGSRKEEEIKGWVTLVEKRSFALAVRYNHLLHTDIFDFYGQIYTHTIAWAIHGKSFVKTKIEEGGTRNFEKSYLGGMLDYWLRKMQQGQSNGIPQGSALMDLLAEIVLSYADRELSERVMQMFGDKRVHVLRYRDDYRIFADNSTDAELVLKDLTEVLRSIGLRLNEKKTQDFNDIIVGSIKPDKWHWHSMPGNYQYPLHLLLAIYKLITKYDSPGQVLRTLKDLRKLLEGTSEEIYRDHKETYIGILINIAYRYPKSIPQVIGIISLLVENWPRTDVQILVKIFYTSSKTSQPMTSWKYGYSA